MAKGTLKDLLVKVKQKEQRPLSPELDMFFLKAGHTQEPRDEGWHPSSISNGMCPRLEVIGKIRRDLLTQGNPPDPKLMRIFWFGSAIHSMYQNKVFGPMGTLYGMWLNTHTKEITTGLRPTDGQDYEYIEPTVHNPEYGIIGHTDGLLILGDGPALLELKTINSRSFEFLNAPREAHVKQANLYMHCTFKKFDHPMPTRTVILYVNKNTSEEKEFWVEKDGSVVQPMFQQIKKVEYSLSENSLPDRLASCKTATSASAKNCPACRVCFMVDTGKTPYRAILQMEKKNV